MPNGLRTCMILIYGKAHLHPYGIRGTFLFPVPSFCPTDTMQYKILWKEIWSSDDLFLVTLGFFLNQIFLTKMDIFLKIIHKCNNHQHGVCKGRREYWLAAVCSIAATYWKMIMCNNGRTLDRPPPSSQEDQICLFFVIFDVDYSFQYLLYTCASDKGYWLVCRKR